MHVYGSHAGLSYTLHTDEVVRDSRYVFRVVWTDRWDMIDELVAAGVLSRVNYGPSTYGHCEYFYN
jgi:hypothetical protein